ncbi:MFS transporter [Methylobacterium sp. J-048]|uniref:MFS transporter n=1 Tax=Methylobacterium sp. J-048 TaxID=2836635 RepID=UPI001FBABDBC|nr:MFS transporter [Methylobacterium sp. J-048]MCJ2056185.1 MFS transporter [Methylobacterium sp. J-048]
MVSQKAIRIELFNFRTPQMRAFHLTWMAFFVCFFAWFATAPLMPIIGADLKLTSGQIYNITIAGVFATILARTIIGPMCDKYGPRLTYTILLALGSLPVFGVAFAWDYSSFLIFRLLIGIIGASFVVTQYHTSVMFAPNVVGTANATVGGWGNAGGGFTQSVMPLVLGAIVAAGVSTGTGWRYSMIVPGVLMLVMAGLYWRFTQDTPEGNIPELRRQGVSVDSGKKGGWEVMKTAAQNYRVWLLAACYGASFGVELFVHSIAVTYYYDHYHLSVIDAGYAVGAFGLLALFARALGGLLSDRVARTKGLDGRTWLLFGLMMGEGVFLVAFSQAIAVSLAITAMLVFGLFTHMACGSLYALVPFIDRKVLGGVAGIIGAGGNIGGVAAGFLLRGTGDVQLCFLILGCAAIACACGAALIRFSIKHKQDEQALYDAAIAQRYALMGGSASVLT